MLKLMKYEIIHSVRTFTVAFLTFLAGCVLIPIVIKFFMGSNTGELIIGILGFLFFGLLFAISIALFISVFMHFNQSMFQRSGYLTLTLPRTNLQIIVSKLIIAIAWIFIGMVVLIGGILLLVSLTSIMDGTFNFMFLFEGLSMLFSEFFENPSHTFIVLFNGFTELAFLISLLYLSLTITHTKWIRKYRLILSVIIFFLISIVFGTVISSELFNTIFSSSFFDIFNIWAGVFYAIISAGFVMMTVYLFDHKIEIE